MINEIYYDYVGYWKKEGTLNKQDSLSFRVTREHDVQIPPLLEAVKKINPKSILEVGAGWGRIVKEIRKISDAEYLALDLSYDRLKMIDDKTIGRKVIDFMDFNSIERRYDLIIAVEVLMHIPPDIITQFVAKMKVMGKTLITLDYDPQEPRDIVLAEHNFLHDYKKLLPFAEINQVNYVQKMRVWK